MGKTNKLKGSFEPLVQAELSKVYPEFQYEAKTFQVQLEKKYTPDWYWDNNGKTYAIEAKGFLRIEDREKILAFVNQYPEVQFHLILQKDNSLYAGSKYKYSDWCKKNNISYSVRTIPEGLFNG